MPPRILSQLKPIVGTVFRYWSNLSRYNAVVFPALSRPSMATWSGVPVGSASRKPPLVPLLPIPAPIPLLPPSSHLPIPTTFPPLTLLPRLSFNWHLASPLIYLPSTIDRSCLISSFLLPPSKFPPLLYLMPNLLSNFSNPSSSSLSFSPPFSSHNSLRHVLSLHANSAHTGTALV